jgi:diguanylate cyclase
MSHWRISTGFRQIFYPGASIGVVEINPDNIDADSALRIADRLCIRIKTKNTKAVFTSQLIHF